mmetsp:Transcript_9699/g.27777  ORF Transcript_9699/g.27777 Transcript_9699/m.27777 type:complete len:279 (-) Transcript_9699:886-1722(-)
MFAVLKVAEILCEVCRLPRPARQGEQEQLLVAQVGRERRRGFPKALDQLPLIRQDRLRRLPYPCPVLTVDDTVGTSRRKDPHQRLGLAEQVVCRDLHNLDKLVVLLAESLGDHALLDDMDDVLDVAGAGQEVIQQAPPAPARAHVQRFPPGPVNVRLRLSDLVRQRINCDLNLKSLRGALMAAEVSDGSFPDVRDCEGNNVQVVDDDAVVEEPHAWDEGREDRDDGGGYGGHLNDEILGPPPPVHMGVDALHDALLGVHEGHHPMHVPAEPEKHGVPG